VRGGPGTHETSCSRSDSLGAFSARMSRDWSAAAPGGAPPNCEAGGTEIGELHASFSFLVMAIRHHRRFRCPDAPLRPGCRWTSQSASAARAATRRSRSAPGTANSSHNRARSYGRNSTLDGSPPCSPQMPSFRFDLTDLPFWTAILHQLRPRRPGRSNRRVFRMRSPARRTE